MHDLTYLSHFSATESTEETSASTGDQSESAEGDNDDDEDDSESATVGAATIGVGGISLGTGMKVDFTASVKANNDNSVDAEQLLQELGQHHAGSGGEFTGLF